MSNIVYEKIADKWKLNKGLGIINCNAPLDSITLTKVIVEKVIAKDINRKILIVVDNYNTRQKLLKEFGDQFENINLTILNIDYIKKEYNYNYDLIIVVNCDKFNSTLIHLKNSTKFMLVTTKYINLKDKQFNRFYTFLPLIQVDHDDIQKLKRAKLYSPVEETRIGVDLNDSDRSEYEKQSTYITNTMVIIGDIHNIAKIKSGDPRLGLSAADVRDQIARNNGWSETLDMSIPFNRQIDENYNPNILLEKACSVYEVMKNRRDLVTDNKNKLNAILNIVKENIDKKIIIISKRGEFAATITKYLNENDIYCGDYHDCIEKCIAVEPDGTPILIKSGVNKGQPKIIGAQAISSQNLFRYNQNELNILSAKNSSINNLEIECDIIIITSPLCDEYITIKSKFKSIEFNTKHDILYRLYCTNTIEEKNLCNEKLLPNHKIKEDTEKNIIYDKISGDVIL